MNKTEAAQFIILAKAWIGGETLQLATPTFSEWNDLSNDSLGMMYPPHRYRIKPKSEPAKILIDPGPSAFKQFSAPLTRIAALEITRDLWCWLAQVGSTDKHLWPGWRKKGGPVPDMMFDCACCSYAGTTKSGAAPCKNCPLYSLWGSDCDAFDSPFRRWRKAESATERSKCAEEIWVAARTELGVIAEQERLSLTKPTAYTFTIKAEPKFRKWRPEEVPVGALLSPIKGNCPSGNMLIVEAENGSLTRVCNGRLDSISLQKVIEGGFYHSRDFGKTWTRCGVEE